MAPLSEHEKAQLRLLEEQLHAEDPKFVKAMRSKRMGSKWQRSQKPGNPVLGLVAFTVGVIILLAGITMHSIGIGILGCAVAFMGFLSSYFTFNMGKSAAPASAQRPKTRSEFMANLERQWDERKKNEL